jgi:hypothetical protein
LLAIVAAAVAVKAAVVAVPLTTTEAGTFSRLLLLLTVTVDPPDGAGWLNVTVQLLAAFGPSMVGLQTTLDTSPGTTRLIVAVRELLPSVAVTVALWLLEIVAAAVAVKAAVVAVALTATEAGTFSSLVLLPSVTLDPPAGAGWLNVTVQLLVPPGPRLVGLQTTPDTSAAGTRLTVAVCELLPSVAVTVAL